MFLVLIAGRPPTHPYARIRVACGKIEKVGQNSKCNWNMIMQMHFQMHLGALWKRFSFDDALSLRSPIKLYLCFKGKQRTSVSLVILMFH